MNISLFNNNEIIPLDLYLNNSSINNDISQNKYNFLNDKNSFENDQKKNESNKIYSLELKDNMKI